MPEQATENQIKESVYINESDVSDTAVIYGQAELKRSRIGDHSIIGNQAIVIDSEIGSRVSLNRRNYILKAIIGDNSYTGIGTMLRSCSVGKFCSLSWNVSVGGGDHDYDRLTTSPLWRLEMMANPAIKTHDVNKELQNRFEQQPHCTIENDVWIGTNAVVLRDVHIGTGAVIGAGAVVTRDVEPYSIVVGVPAKPIRRRFDDSIIDDLLSIRWWDWSIEDIRRHKDIIFNTRIDSDAVSRLKTIAQENQS